MFFANLLKRKKEPSLELNPLLYYNYFLKESDPEYLKLFVKSLGDRLNLPCAILAVGSSLLPKEYFNDIKLINKQDPKVKAFETYRDIDLLIVPEEIVELCSLKIDISQALYKENYDFDLKSDTTSGVSYHKQRDGSYAPFLHIDYGRNTITSKLKNGKSVDLILGREDITDKTAEEKINFERKKNYPFSILYRR